MSNKPVIAVIACSREVEGEPASIVKQRYLDAVSRYADALPIIVPPTASPAEAAALLARVDAVLLTGSNSNIEPSRYGGGAAGAPPFDPPRDETALHLIAGAIAAKKPLFGICRGLQELNVAFGGTLADERALDGVAVSHHAPAEADLQEMFTYGHRATAETGGVLADLVGRGSIPINSVHFQRVDAVGKGLKVEARAEDGVIEALSSTQGEAPVLAVQWHPEWQPEGRHHDLAFWRYVGTQARKAMTLRTDASL
ncbi:gamma-glutamyl-gamma-aminobutyrate hydrolase family protein [Stappia indica]|uniref:gamma-glutamyl-gamma-aminobutyrate hydrolase family protein n=1 Tax=Stappia indica TaxID=538381 RepID=UPI001CD354C1|nr:gamma-glutamyl-gamma-aminobutyrate hydrolase family protein [Stappia indica]MCA1296745.1 gamma-glutamyl-gamma-aminobutyrate hydrolase family protein [Stappia indica]